MESPTRVVLDVNLLKPANSHLSDIIDYNNCFLIVKLTQTWFAEVPSSCGLCPFEMFPSGFEHFLAFWLTLYFPCPRPGISHLSKVSFNGEWHSETYLRPLGLLIALGISLLIDPSQWTELWNAFLKKFFQRNVLQWKFPSMAFLLSFPVHVCISPPPQWEPRFPTSI